MQRTLILLSTTLASVAHAQVVQPLPYPHNEHAICHSPEKLWYQSTLVQQNCKNIRANESFDAKVYTNSGTQQPITEVTTDNAADGSAQGIEVELTYAATERLLLGLNLGTADTKYFNIQPGAQINENTEFGGSPDRTTDAYVQYGWNLGGGMLSARFAANYWGSYWRSNIPSFREDAYGGNTQSGDFWTTSARLVYTPANANYEVSVWGNNLNNAYNINSGFMDSIWQFDFAGVDAPREAGVTLKMRF